MLSPSEVSAVIVTRGDTDLAPVLESLAAFSEVVVWDNSVEEDAGTLGRYLALARTTWGVIYSQDDDIIHTPENHTRILAEYDPGYLTGCMWPEWSQGAKEQGIPNGYDDLVFAGSGSVWECNLPHFAYSQYLDHYPDDDFFRLWADTIIGVIAPTKQLDIRFTALPHAEDDTRMCNLPDAVANKTEAIRRARQVREAVYA